MAYVTITGILIDGPVMGLKIPLSDKAPPDLTGGYEFITVDLVDGTTAYYDLDPDMQTVGQPPGEGYQVCLGFRHRELAAP
jgi:hypothetical protein